MKKSPEKHKEQSVIIPTRAQNSLGGRLFIPADPIGQSILVSSATGMLQKFYFAFSRHFASLGYAVLTFDYSGIGDSGGSPEALRENTTNLVEWGSRDQAEALRFLKDFSPESKITVITHSIGGQICGFNPEYASIDRIIMVASQNSYWKNFQGRHKLKMWMFWNAMIPWGTALFGYFPAKHLGLFENLPKNMVRQWRQWGTHPDYLMGFRDSSYLFDALKMPILSLSFPADPLAPPKRWIGWLHNIAMPQYAGYTIQTKEIIPGHFGYFRPPFKDTLWKYTHQWIQTDEWK